MKFTGLLDRNGKEIKEGDFVSLAENMTANNSTGILPNGYFFDEDDVYEVYWDERINNWSLKLNLNIELPENTKHIYDMSFMNNVASLFVLPDDFINSPEYEVYNNMNYLNHAVGLLHDESVEIVENSND